MTRREQRAASSPLSAASSPSPSSSSSSAETETGESSPRRSEAASAASTSAKTSQAPAAAALPEVEVADEERDFIRSTARAAVPVGDSSAMGTSSVARAGCAGRAKPCDLLEPFLPFFIVASASAAATEEELEELEESDAASAVAAWAIASSLDAGIGGSFLAGAGEGDGEEEEGEEGLAPNPRFEEEEEAATMTTAAAADRQCDFGALEENRLSLLSLNALLLEVGLLAARERSIVRGNEQHERMARRSDRQTKKK